MPRQSVALLMPPGWTLLTGGPHLALPLLAGALRRAGNLVHLADWNLEISARFGARITERSARAISPLELDSMNAPYFQADRQLLDALAGSSASWEPRLGYQDSVWDCRSPESVRQALAEPGPLDPVMAGLAAGLLRDCRPDIVGINVSVEQQILPAFYAARMLRRAGFEGPVLLGGNIITRLADSIAQPWVFDFVDGLMVFQGEVALDVFCRASGGPDWSSVPNLIWRDEGGIRRNATQTLEPSQFGAPDFQGLPLTDYWGVPFLPAVASRGCYYGKCSFCAIPYGWGNSGFLGNGRAEEVAAQLRYAATRHGVRRFKFVEESLHPGLLLRVADRLMAEGVDVEFEGFARLDDSWLAPGLLQRLSAAGLRKLYLGLELAPSQRRSVLNKADHADPVALLEAMAGNGILAHLFCMCGYPGTGWEEAAETAEFTLRHEALIDTVDVFPFGFATHTSVDGITAKPAPGLDWALERAYEPAAEGVLSMEEVSALTAEIELAFWRQYPHWLHPTYRLVSPWTGPMSARG